MGLDKSRLWRTLEDELSTRIQDANAVVGFVVSCRPECTGMGSTLTAVALADDGRCLIANVVAGDDPRAGWLDVLPLRGVT